MQPFESNILGGFFFSARLKTNRKEEIGKKTEVIIYIAGWEYGSFSVDAVGMNIGEKDLPVLFKLIFDLIQF